MQAGIRVKIGAQTDQRDLNRVEMQFNKMMNRMSGKQVAFNINGKSFTQPLGRITAQANEFTKSLEASNARVIAFGASVGIINAVSDAFKGLVAETVRFEKTLADINVILNSSNQGLQAFGDNLFKVAKNTAQSFNVVATAALEFSRQGLSMEETLKRTNDALILTRLTSLKAEEAVAGLTAAVNAFAETGLTTTNIIDKLAAVDVRFAVSSEDLIHALERTGAVAIDAGVELNDLIGLVTALQQTTARGGAVIGNGLKTIFTRIQRPESIRQIEELGVSVRNLTGAVLPADKILLNMAKSFSTLTQAQQSNVVQFSAGIFQANVFRAALRDLAKDSSLYEQASKVAGDAAGEAALKNEKLNKTLAALASQSSNAIRELAGVMGELMLKPEIGGFMEAFLSTVEGLKNALGGGEEEGSNFAQGFVRGIGNVLTGPGLLAFGAVFVKMLFNVGKFASQSIKDVLGIVDKKEKLKQMEEAIVGVLAQNKHIQEGLNELEGDRAAQEKFILKVIEAQTNAMVKQKQIASSLAGPLLRSGVSTDLTVDSNDFVDLDKDSKIDSFGAKGVIPRHTAKREKQGAMQAGYQPGPIDSMEVKGMGRVVYNKAETVKKFPGMDQPAIMPPESSRAGESYKKDFNKQHGFDPYSQVNSYSGTIPNFGKVTLKNDVTGNQERMHLRGTPFQDLPNYAKDQITRPDGSLGGGNIKFKTQSSSLKTSTFRNIGSYLEALGVYDIETTIPFDFIDLPVNKKGRMTSETRKGLTEGTTKQRGDFAESKFLESDAGKGYLSTALDDQGVVDAVSADGAPTEVKAASISLQNIFEKSIRRYSNQKFRDTLESVAAYHRDPSRYENPNAKIDGFSTSGEIADALSESIVKLEEDSIVKNLSTLARMGEYTIPGMTKEELKSSIQGQNFRKDLLASGIGQGEKDVLNKFGLNKGFIPNYKKLYQAYIGDDKNFRSNRTGDGWYFDSQKGTDKALDGWRTVLSTAAVSKDLDNLYAREYSISDSNLKEMTSGIYSSGNLRKLRVMSKAFQANNSLPDQNDEEWEDDLLNNSGDGFDEAYDEMEGRLGAYSRLRKTQRQDRLWKNHMAGTKNNPLPLATYKNDGMYGSGYIIPDLGPGDVFRDGFTIEDDKKIRSIFSPNLNRDNYLIERKVSGKHLDNKEFADMLSSVAKNPEKAMNASRRIGIEGIKEHVATQGSKGFIPNYVDYIGLTKKISEYSTAKDQFSNHGDLHAQLGIDGVNAGASSIILSALKNPTSNNTKAFKNAWAKADAGQQNAKIVGWNFTTGFQSKKWTEREIQEILEDTNTRIDKLVSGTDASYAQKLGISFENAFRTEVGLGGVSGRPHMDFPENSLGDAYKNAPNIGLSRNTNSGGDAYRGQKGHDPEHFIAKYLREKFSPGGSSAITNKTTQYDKILKAANDGTTIKLNNEGRFNDIIGVKDGADRSDRTINRSFPLSSILNKALGLKAELEGDGSLAKPANFLNAKIKFKYLQDFVDDLGVTAKGLVPNFTGDEFWDNEYFKNKKKTITDEETGTKLHYKNLSPGYAEIMHSARGVKDKKGGAFNNFNKLMSEFDSVGSGFLVPQRNGVGPTSWAKILSMFPQLKNRVQPGLQTMGDWIMQSGYDPIEIRFDSLKELKRKVKDFYNEYPDDISLEPFGGLADMDEANSFQNLTTIKVKGKGDSVVGFQNRGHVPNYNVDLSTGYYDRKAIAKAISKVYKSRTRKNLSKRDLDFPVERYIAAIKDKQADDPEGFVSNYPGGGMTIAGVKFPAGLNEISMALMKHGQFIEEENRGLIPNFSAVERIRKSQKRRIKGTHEHLLEGGLSEQDIQAAEDIQDYMRGNMSLSPTFGFDKQTLAFRGTAQDYSQIFIHSNSQKNRQNLIDLVGSETKLDHILSNIMLNHTQAVLNARGKLETPKDPLMQGAMFGGLIPSFSNPLTDAINREKAAGVPAHRIRVEKSSQLKSPQNPAGLAVTNTRDEPGGVAQGIRRARTMRIDPKKHGAAKGFTPNFQDYQAPPPAPPAPVPASPTAPTTPAAPKDDVALKSQQFGEELQAQAEQMLNSMKALAATYDSQSEAGKEINEKIKNLESSIENAKNNFDTYESAEAFTKSSDIETSKAELEETALKAASSKSDPARSQAGKQAVEDMKKFNSQVQGATSSLDDLEKGNGASLQKLFYMQSAISMANGALQQMAENGSAASKSIAKFGLGLSNVAASFMQAKELGGMLSQMVGTRDEQGRSDGTEINFKNLFGEGRRKRLEATDAANRRKELEKSKEAPGMIAKLGQNMTDKGGISAQISKFGGGVGKTFGMISKIGGRMIPVFGQLYGIFTAVNEAVKMFGHLIPKLGLEEGEGLMDLMASASDKAAKRIEKLGAVSEATSAALEAVQNNAKIQDELAQLEIKGSQRTRAENAKFHELQMKGIDAKGKETEALEKLQDESVVGAAGMKLYNLHMSKAGNTTEDTVKALRELEMATKLLTLQNKQVELFEKALSKAGEGKSGKFDREAQAKAAANQGTQMAALFDSDLTKRNKDGTVDQAATQANLEAFKEFSASSVRDPNAVTEDMDFDKFVRKLNLNDNVDSSSIADTLNSFFQVIEDEDFFDTGEENEQIEALVKAIGNQLLKGGSAGANKKLFMEDAMLKKTQKRMVSAETKRLDLILMDIKHRNSMLSINRDLINKQMATVDAQGLVAKETLVLAEKTKMAAELQEKQAEARQSAENEFNKKLLKSMPKILDTGNLGEGISIQGTEEDLKKSQATFNERIRAAQEKVMTTSGANEAMKDSGMDKNNPEELRTKATQKQIEQAQSILEGISVVEGAQDEAGSMQKQLNVIAEKLADTDIDPLTKSIVLAAMEAAQVVQLEEDIEKGLADMSTNLKKTLIEIENQKTIQERKNKLALQELNITQKTLEGAVIVKSRIEEHGNILDAIGQNLIGEAANLQVINDSLKNQADIEAKSFGLRAKIFEELRKKARESAIQDRNSFLSDQNNNALLGADPSTLGDREKEVQKNLLKSQIYKLGSEMESAHSAAQTASLKARFFQMEENMFKLVKNQLSAEEDGLKFSTHEAAKKSMILDITGQRLSLAAMQLDQEIISSIEARKMADRRRQLLEIGDKRYILALSAHDTEMSDLEDSVQATKDKLAISVLKGDIRKTAELQLEEELANLQKTSLISAANELIISGKNEMAEKMKRANELQDMTNRMQEMRLAKDKAFVDQKTLDRNVEAGVVTQRMAAFGEMRSAGTKASITGNADDLQAAAQAQLAYNRAVNGTTSAMDQINVEMANMAVSASNLKGDLVSIGFDSMRSELKNVFATIADGSKSIGDAFLDMAHGVGKAISDRLMEHSIDQIISNLTFAITGKKPQDEAEKMRNAMQNAHDYHVAELKGQADIASKKMGEAITAAMAGVDKDIFTLNIPELKELENKINGFAGTVSDGFQEGGEEFKKQIKGIIGESTLSSVLSTHGKAMEKTATSVDKLAQAIEKFEGQPKPPSEGTATKLATSKANENNIPPPVPPPAPAKTNFAAAEAELEKIRSNTVTELKHGGSQVAMNLALYGSTKKVSKKSRNATSEKEYVDLPRLQRRTKDINDFTKGQVFDISDTAKIKGGTGLKFDYTQRRGKEVLNSAKVMNQGWKTATVDAARVQRATQEAGSFNKDDAYMQRLRNLMDFEQKLKRAKELEANGSKGAAEALTQLKAAADKVNIKLEQIANTPTTKIATEYEGGKIQKYHQGGLVRNFGKGGEVPALLEAGEYVVPKDTVSRYNKGGRTKAGERSRAAIDGGLGLLGASAGSYLVNKWMGGDKNVEDGRPTFDMNRFNSLGLDSDVSMNTNDRRLSARFQANNKVTQDYKAYLRDLSDYETAKTNQKFSERMGKLQGYLGTFVGMAASTATQGIALGAQALKTGTQNFVQGKMGLGKKENVAAYQKLKAAGKDVNYSEVAKFNKSQIAKGVDVSKIDYSSFNEVKGSSNFGAFLNPRDAFRSSKDRTGAFGASKAAKPSGDSGSFFRGFFGMKSKSQKAKDKVSKQKLIDFYNSSGEFEDKGGFEYNSFIGPRKLNSGGQVPAMLTKGEAVIPKNVASRIGYENLNQMNTTGNFPIVQGRGGIDNVGPVSLSSGDFVLRKSSTEKLSRSNPNMMRFASQNPEGFRRASRGYYNGGVVDQGLTYPSTSMGVGGSSGTRQAPELSPQPDSTDTGSGSSSSGGAVTNNINVNVTIDKSGGESSTDSSDAQGPESSYAKEKELSSKIKAAVLDVIRQEKRVGGELS